MPRVSHVDDTRKNIYDSLALVIRVRTSVFVYIYCQRGPAMLRFSAW